MGRSRNWKAKENPKTEESLENAPLERKVQIGQRAGWQWLQGNLQKRIERWIRDGETSAGLKSVNFMFALSEGEGLHETRDEKL